MGFVFHFRILYLNNCSIKITFLCFRSESAGEKMEAPPVAVMPVTGGTINMMEYLLQGNISHSADRI